MHITYDTPLADSDIRRFIFNKVTSAVAAFFRAENLLVSMRAHEIILWLSTDTPPIFSVKDSNRSEKDLLADHSSQLRK